MTRCLRCGCDFTIPVGKKEVHLPAESYCIDCLVEMSENDREWEKHRNEWHGRTKS